ncbi:class I SAM-dependent methyltransferase [Pseudobacteriovorax antillogorgiicola]|uniref:Methyltransferase domain-containing protein n=1 Tax=Pseudobacteriovorax antillogorgiicola TaxID=1513793 RepID=A0A1Y6CX18_9BACT|nr:class I SAM-dependent methyltransferase [Pseudobacteriovorax antillogorgiicola]TCS41562.1 methyltransferase family protein [Pseudobacteriovorax antillogorgiicola]SMF83392.1 Methyltransferase domain-containing protein [Pseudobacteriovorax antillogorgiicola]
MDEAYIRLLVDLHCGQERQGPGGPESTQRAIDLAGLKAGGQLAIADIGCGTGSSSLYLAQQLGATLTSVDFAAPFIEKLKQKAQDSEVQDSIKSLVANMEDLPFDDSSFDVLWSEGAIYNIGFENGVRRWRRFLRPGGTLAVSEITWITGARPKEIEDYWKDAYPEIGTASSKMKILEAEGYSPIGYFYLPHSDWLDHYYLPLKNQLEAFASRNEGNSRVDSIVAQEKAEFDMYDKFKDYYSYGFYIARKID